MRASKPLEARYARFADFLAARGFHTYAHDHRGHGFTTAPDAPPGRFGTPNGGDEVIADVAAIHGLIRKEHPDLPGEALASGAAFTGEHSWIANLCACQSRIFAG